MKEKERERERKKDPYGMSCHESPLKQTESLEKKRKEGRRRDGGMFMPRTQTPRRGKRCRRRRGYNVNVWVRMRMTAGVVSVRRCVCVRAFLCVCVCVV